VVYLSDTVDDFQTFFHPNKEKIQTEVHDVLQKAVNFVKPRIAKNKIEIIINKYVEIQITTYVNELVQIILNLLNNAIDALNMAIKRNPNRSENIIHHSDRGVQYCSNEYVNELKKHNIKISMTEENHCYENAIAERVNGILKDEFYIDQTFSDIKHAQNAIKNAIKLYNSKRLHLSLEYKTPENVYKSIA